MVEVWGIGSEKIFSCNQDVGVVWRVGVVVQPALRFLTRVEGCDNDGRTLGRDVLAIFLKAVGLTEGQDEAQCVERHGESLFLFGGSGLFMVPAQEFHGLQHLSCNRHGDTPAMKGSCISEGLARITTGARMTSPAPAETTTKATPAMVITLPTRIVLWWRFSQSVAKSMAVNSCGRSFSTSRQSR
ncbi:hypothetical protein DB31_8619 [Hyalangium minutum]|uniref:Uncharacterized protein n=1 Tax=Hyalangium minutum TaxID=394096 RepID=A0A085WHV3_9BACT|nr:hypothetical protein DB31_8619 [Hyalangium minutum]